MKVELLVDAQDRLGECALWCDRTHALYWTDIEASILRRWRDDNASTIQWKLPQRLGSFALTARPSQLLLGLEHGVALFDTETGAMSDVVPVERDQPAIRINDGRCDRQGRFVFGMFSSARDGGKAAHFYRVDASLEVERLGLPPATVANSIAFSPDGSRLYFTDTPTRNILCADYHADGRIGRPAVFVSVPESEGFPDGACVDADGGLWSAQWDGGAVVRYDADGRQTDRIALPVTRPTCPAFGGVQLERLFVTSARIGLAKEALRDQPHAGGVFALAPQRRGLPESRFVTSRRP